MQPNTAQTRSVRRDRKGGEPSSCLLCLYVSPSIRLSVYVRLSVHMLCVVSIWKQCLGRQWVGDKRERGEGDVCRGRQRDWFARGEKCHSECRSSSLLLSVDHCS